MFDIGKFDVAKYDRILSRGLSQGLGNRESMVCIEAAICEALGLPHGDDPKCVASAVRSYKITLNDASWSSPEARARGLHDLGLAQLGSLGVVDDAAFVKLMAEKTIRVLLPALFRELYPKDETMLAVALRCEQEGTQEAAATAAARAATAEVEVEAAATAAARAAARAAKVEVEAAATARAAAEAAWAAEEAAWAARAAVGVEAWSDKYLLLSAKLALETLTELKSPGVALLTR